MLARLRNWIAKRREQRLARVRALLGDGMADYVPQVDRQDVLRILERDYRSADPETIIAQLAQYGTQKWHGEPHRVHLAILKMSAGDPRRIPEFVKLACSDFRDVIAPAEYPQFFKSGFTGIGQMTPEAVGELKENDWRQYETWLKRTDKTS